MLVDLDVSIEEDRPFYAVGKCKDEVMVPLADRSAADILTNEPLLM